MSATRRSCVISKRSDPVLRNHPILSAIFWAALGALAATIVFLAYAALQPASEKSDAELDREAAQSLRR